MSDSHATPAGAARTVIAAALTSCLAIVWAHALAALAGLPKGVDPSVFSAPLTGLSLAVAVLSAGASRGRPAWLVAFATGALGALSLAVVAPSAWMAGAGLVPIALLSAALSSAIVRRLPAWLDEAPRRHRLRSALWLLATVVAIVQIARLSTWMTDPSSDWYLSTKNPFWAKHECLPAYVHGAEMALRGEPNVYDAAHYPALNPKADPHTAFEGMTIEDPFQYAPQFLLWPAGAVSVTDHYPAIKLVWFALQTTLLLGMAAGIALWVGGRAGRVALLLLPLALSAFPALHDLQYGQFHLAAILLAMGAMVAFSHGRSAAGGALLAVAILSKIFPGILLLPLIAQRRWRPVLWTAGMSVALTAVSLALLGTAPFAAFTDYHLPRLQSGAAFAFGQAWPEIATLIIADNQGVYGLVTKLAAMGVPGLDDSVAAWVGRVYSVVLAAGAFWVGLRTRRASREEQAVVWLSLLGLGSMMSTGAFGDYVPVTATWLLTLLAHRMAEPRVRRWLLPVWVFQYTLLGTTPIGDWFEPRVMIPLSAVAVVMLLGLFTWPLVRAARRREAQGAKGPVLDAMPASG